MRHHAIPLCCLLSLAAVVETSHAQTETSSGEEKLSWDPGWPRFQWWEYAATGAAFGVLAYVQFGTHTLHEARWERPILFDRPFQEALRLSSRSDRENAQLSSDVFWGASWAFPLADSLIISLAVHRNVDVAWQLMAMNAQVYGIVAATSRIIHKTVRRARPLQLECRRDPDYDANCFGSPAGFFSGHTAMAAASAGLTCVHHQFLPLYGGGWADRAACAGAVTTSVLTGLLRIMGDKHFLSDVLVGYAFGFATGYLLPRLLHYRHTPAAGKARRYVVMPTLMGQGVGLALWSGI